MTGVLHEVVDDAEAEGLGVSWTAVGGPLLVPPRQVLAALRRLDGVGHR